MGVKMETIKTYGKRNSILNLIDDVRYRFKLNPYTIRLWKSKGFNIYIPELNKLKMGVMLGLVGLCLVTPATNLFIPFLIKWGIK